MLIKTILNKIHRFKSFVYASEHFSMKGGDLVLEIGLESRKNSQAICSECEKPCTCYDHLETRRYEFIVCRQRKVD